MKKIKIYLRNVEKQNNKIHNVVSHSANNDTEINDALSKYDKNDIVKYEFMNVK